MSRRHAPRATAPVPEGVHTCPCGQPAPDTHICATCAERVRDNLLTIAERWPELENALQWRETPNAGPTPPQPSDIDPDEGAGNVTGLTINEQVIHAMRKAASIVRYCTLTLRDEADRAGTSHTPPARRKARRWSGDRRRSRCSLRERLPRAWRPASKSE